LNQFIVGVEECVCKDTDFQIEKEKLFLATIRAAQHILGPNTNLKMRPFED
jgi:hypothetical protein